MPLSLSLSRIGAALGSGSVSSTVNGGGGGLPPVEETAALYADDFESYAAGTQMTSFDPAWTRVDGSGSTPTANGSGRLQAYSGDSTEVGTSFIGIDIGDADHWVEQDLGWGLSAANNRGIMAAAADHNNWIGFRSSTVSEILRQVSAGTSTALATINYQSNKRFSNENPSTNDSAGVLYTIQVISGRAYFYHRRVRVGSVDGYAITPSGTYIGFTNGNSPWGYSTTGCDGYEAGPLAGKVKIGTEWTTGDSTKQGTVRAFPRVQGLGGYAKGAADITVPVEKIGTVEGYVFSLVDPVTGKRIKLHDDVVWEHAQSVSAVDADNDLVTVRIPCGLTTLEDDSARDPESPYFLTIAPLNDTRGFDTSPTPFAVCFNILYIGQSNAANFGQNATGTYNNNAAGWSYFGNSWPVETKAFITPTSDWITSSLATTTGAKDPVVLTDWLDKLDIGMPVMVSIAAIGAQPASVLDPGAATAQGSYLDFHMTEMGGSFDCMVLLQGEDEVNQAAITNALGWESEWQGNIPNYESRNGQTGSATVPLFVIPTGQYAGASNDACGNIVRDQQASFINSMTGLGTPTYLATNPVGIAMGDSVHFSHAAAGQPRLGSRVALTIAEYLGLSSYDGRGPLIDTANISRVGAVITIPVLLNGAHSLSALDGDGTDAAASASALTGWKVADSYNSADGTFSGVKTISSAVLSGSNIVITLSADPGGAVVVANYHGVAPDVSSWVFGVYSDATLGSFNIAMEPILSPLAVS